MTDTTPELSAEDAELYDSLYNPPTINDLNPEDQAIYDQFFPTN
jgi:hypothetical protein